MAEREATSKTPSLPPSLPFSLSLSLDLPPSLPPSLSLFPPSSLSSNSPPLSLFFLLAGSSLCRVSLFCDFPSIYPSISPTYISFFDFPINACILARGSCLRSLLSSVPLPFPLSPLPLSIPPSPSFLSLHFSPLSPLLLTPLISLCCLSLLSCCLSRSLARSLAFSLVHPPPPPFSHSRWLSLACLLARSLARSLTRSAYDAPTALRSTRARPHMRARSHESTHTSKRTNTRAHTRAHAHSHTHTNNTHTQHTHTAAQRLRPGSG